MTTDDAGTYSCTPKRATLWHLQLNVVPKKLVPLEHVTKLESAAISVRMENGTPVFLRPERMQEIVFKSVGAAVKLKCPATGHPMPEVRWTKDGAPLEDAVPGVIRSGRWAIGLERVDLTDSGNYSCYVCNSVGCANFTYTLIVTRKSCHVTTSLIFFRCGLTTFFMHQYIFLYSTARGRKSSSDIVPVGGNTLRLLKEELKDAGENELFEHSVLIGADLRLRCTALSTEPMLWRKDGRDVTSDMTNIYISKEG